MSSPPETGAQSGLEMLGTSKGLRPRMTVRAALTAARRSTALAGGPPHFIVDIGDPHKIKGVKGVRRRALTQSVIGDGHLLSTDFILDLGQADCLPLSAAPRVYYLILGEVVGGGRWTRRGERALAVAAPARGPLHPWTPAAMAIARQNWTMTGSEATTTFCTSAAQRRPAPAAQLLMENLTETPGHALMARAMTVDAEGAYVTAFLRNPPRVWTNLAAAEGSIEKKVTRILAVSAKGTIAEKNLLHQFEGEITRLGAKGGLQPRG